MAGSSPVLAGLRGKCPACGRGALFSGYLRLAHRCAACREDFTIADAGDGPAVFVMFVVGALAVPLGFILDRRLHLPDWLALALTGAAVIVLSLALLPVFKGALFAMQWRHKAGEARAAPRTPDA